LTTSVGTPRARSDIADCGMRRRSMILSLDDIRTRSSVIRTKGRSMMKRALPGIASAGILAVTVGVMTANAQSYRRYGPARTYTPQAYAVARFPAAFRAQFRFPTRTVRKPQAEVPLATIDASRTDERRKIACNLPHLGKR